MSWAALAFFTTVAVVALWESFAPRRKRLASLPLRWFGNGALYGASVLVASATMFALPFVGAMHAPHWSLLSLLSLGPAATFVIGFVASDLVRFSIHRLYHAVPLLWRIHALHHSDTDVDVTTTVRHHPLEALLTAVLSGGLFAVIGIPPAAAAAYFAVCVPLQLVQHGNVRVPRWIDRALGWLIVTPDLHLIHHERDTPNANFADTFTLWDRLTGSFMGPRPEAAEAVYGIPDFDDPHHDRLDRMLLLPWLLPRAATSARAEAASAR